MEQIGRCAMHERQHGAYLHRENEALIAKARRLIRERRDREMAESVK